MKKYLVFTLTAMMLTACTELQEKQSVSEISSSETPTAYQQEADQLRIPETEEHKPVNYKKQTGMWFPYIQYDDYMTGRTEEEFRDSVRKLYSEAKAEGVNTVYLHAHPSGDAYYRSDIFPPGACLDGDYDPLEIMLEEAHALGLSAHAWINPLRCQTEEQMSALSDDIITKKWADDDDCPFIKLVNGRWYLDPSYPEVTELICRCTDEILDRYSVDGIHIDDYFYPTADPSFDAKEFEASGASDLRQWRMENCTGFVQALYNTVKSHDKQLLFGISPQGSVTANYETQFADVKLWAGTPGYCDYIVPQLYFGFRNETCPFAETLALWEEMTCPEVSLIAGLGAYKTGKPDKWAGAAGEQEWVEDEDIIGRQIELVLSSSADGYAIYK